MKSLVRIVTPEDVAKYDEIASIIHLGGIKQMLEKDGFDTTNFSHFLLHHNLDSRYQTSTCSPEGDTDWPVEHKFNDALGDLKNAVKEYSKEQDKDYFVITQPYAEVIITELFENLGHSVQHESREN
jgi:hypothetical protein